MADEAAVGAWTVRDSAGPKKEYTGMEQESMCVQKKRRECVATQKKPSTDGYTAANQVACAHLDESVEVALEDTLAHRARSTRRTCTSASIGHSECRGTAHTTFGRRCGRRNRRRRLYSI